MLLLKLISGTIILFVSFSILAKELPDQSWEKEAPKDVHIPNLAKENIRTDRSSGARFVDGEFSACFKSNVKYNEVVSIVKKLNGIVIAQFPEIGNCFEIQVPKSKDGSGVMKAIKKLKSRQEVINATPDYVGQGS